jgi:hypothetical protein
VLDAALHLGRLTADAGWWRVWVDW